MTWFMPENHQRLPIFVTHSCLTVNKYFTLKLYFLRSFLLVSDTKLPLESRLKDRFLAAVVM